MILKKYVKKIVYNQAKKCLNVDSIDYATIISNHLVPKKSSEEYFKELKSMPLFFNVNDLKYKDEYVWPYIRNRLWIQLYALGNGNIKKSFMSSTEIQKGSDAELKYKYRNSLKKKYNAKELEDIEKEKVDFLFFVVTNAAEQVELEDDRIYHRIADPFFEVAKSIGKAKKIEILRVKTKSLDKSFKYFHPVEYIIPPSIYKYGHTKKMKFGNFIKILKKNIESLIIQGENIRQYIDWEFHTRDFYIDLLRKYNPKVIFLNGFHFQAPLISAADFLNIKTVDLQHGIQVGWNPLYNDWKEMPEEGYQSLPDYFFVWGKKEYDSINKVFKGKKHSPVLSGFPWMERQLELTEKLESKYIKQLNKYKVRIILALQKQPEVPKIYKDLIEKSPNDYLWIVRHHPKGNKFSIKDFTEKKINNLVIDSYYDNITLPHLFKYTDIVISEGSTVAAEADYFGLYNFIFSNKGKGNYTNEIKNGHFFFIKDANEFYSKIKNIDLSVKKPRAELYAKTNLESIFKTLLSGKELK